MISKDRITYLDNNATTQIDPAVLEAMMPYLADFYGNPSSGYSFGKQVGQAVTHAREQIANLLGCEPEEILFTSCGTESNNAAILSSLQIDPDRQHIVTTVVEHSATHKLCETLAKRGYEITWIPVDSQGRFDLKELEQAVRSDTAIVSIMWANNETGVLFPIEEAAEIARKKGVLFHTDAVQAVGKIPISLRETKINFLSVSGHKLHCPKGVGVLYVNRRTRFNPFLIGGGQEGGRRGGTENVASIVGLGKAAELAALHREAEATTVRALRDRFESTILQRIPGAHINGHPEHRLPNTCNVRFDGVEAEGVLILLDHEGICASSGSACTTGSLHASHVLTAMGLAPDQARGSLRFSFGRFNTEADVDKGIAAVEKAVNKLRGLNGGTVSPNTLVAAAV